MLDRADKCVDTVLTRAQFNCDVLKVPLCLCCHIFQVGALGLFENSFCDFDCGDVYFDAVLIVIIFN